MRASFIATLVVVASAFAPALCAPLDSSRDVVPGGPEYPTLPGGQEDPNLDPFDPNSYVPYSN